MSRSKSNTPARVKTGATERLIVNYLADYPQRSASDVADALGITRDAAVASCRRLYARGDLVRADVGRGYVYSLDPTHAIGVKEKPEFRCIHCGGPPHVGPLTEAPRCPKAPVIDDPELN